MPTVCICDYILTHYTDMNHYVKYLTSRYYAPPMHAARFSCEINSIISRASLLAFESASRQITSCAAQKRKRQMKRQECAIIQCLTRTSVQFHTIGDGESHRRNVYRPSRLKEFGSCDYLRRKCQESSPG